MVLPRLTVAVWNTWSALQGVLNATRSRKYIPSVRHEGDWTQCTAWLQIIAAAVETAPVILVGYWLFWNGDVVQWESTVKYPLTWINTCKQNNVLVSTCYCKVNLRMFWAWFVVPMHMHIQRAKFQGKKPGCCEPYGSSAYSKPSQVTVVSPNRYAPDKSAEHFHWKSTPSDPWLMHWIIAGSAEPPHPAPPMQFVCATGDDRRPAVI